MLPLRGWPLCITGAQLVDHVNQVQRLSTNWFIWYSADTCKPCQKKHNGFSQKNMFAFPKFVAARIIDPIARHTSHHQSSGARSEWTLSQQYVWQSTRVLVGDFEMYVCDSQQSTMAEEGDVLIVLLWTLRQQCVWRSTIAVVYKPRIDNNRWKLWQSIGRTSDIHKQMTHSVKQGSLLSCVIDQPTEALINHIDQFGQPCQIRSIHTYSRFTIFV